MGADRHKSCIAVVVDAEGERYEYVSFARNRRTAKKEVRRRRDIGERRSWRSSRW